MNDTVLLTIDIGNTNISLGVFDYQGGSPSDKDLAQHWRLSTHRELTSDELAVSLRALFQHEERATGEVTDVIICSVVPPLLPIWERVVAKLFDRAAYVVGPGMRTGMPVRYENPHEVGADRIVNSVAAYELLGGPVIAVDFGTATTFDCVSQDGEYVGGFDAGLLQAFECCRRRLDRQRAARLRPRFRPRSRPTCHFPFSKKIARRQRFSRR